jgi:hypothetical protein
MHLLAIYRGMFEASDHKATELFKTTTMNTSSSRLGCKKLVLQVVPKISSEQNSQSRSYIFLG